MAAFVFLKLNGFTLEADESVFEMLVLQAAQGQVGKDAIADFFEKIPSHNSPASPSRC